LSYDKVTADSVAVNLAAAASAIPATALSLPRSVRGEIASGRFAPLVPTPSRPGPADPLYHRSPAAFSPLIAALRAAPPELRADPAI